MFREIVTHSGGTSEGTANEAHALLLLRRAVRRGYGIEATREGGALITWTRRQIGGHLAHRSITLVPQMPVGNLTEAITRDLTLIGDVRSPQYVTNDYGRRVILADLAEVSPMATAAIRARRLVTTDEGAPVRLTLTARLGLLAAAHRTTTTEPEGWHHSDLSAGLNKPGRRAGLMYSSVSAATCTCKQLTGAHGGDRTEARHLALLHRQDMAAAFVVGLPTRVTDAINA